MNGKVGIICAADTELEPFLPLIQNCRVSERAMLKIYEGTIHQVAVVALYSGVCKVNAAIATQILIDHYQVNLVVNAGTAGGMDETVRLFDTIVSTQVAYHDVADDVLTEFHPNLPSIYFEADKGLVALTKRAAEKTANRVLFGRSVTGEQFIAEENRARILQTYRPLSVDMETAGVAHVCYVHAIPFIAIRTVTDTASHSGVANFEENCEKAAGISKDVVLLLLDELSREA